MKKNYLLISLILFCLVQLASAQEYKPFPTANAMWRESTGPHIKSNMEDYQYLILGDTVINDKTYHKLQKTGIQSDGSNPSHIEYYPINYSVGYIRNDTLEKKVWYISPDDEAEQLLYDFNWQIGDTINERNFEVDVITNIDVLPLADGLHKRFEVTRNSIGIFHIIEGIGNTIGLLQLVLPDPRGNTLLCFSVNEETIYKVSWQDNCDPVYLAIEDYEQKKTSIILYPNPAYSTLQIKGIENFQNFTVSIYTTYGQLIMQEQVLNKDDIIHIENLINGIYIVNVQIKERIIAKCKLIKL